MWCEGTMKCSSILHTTYSFVVRFFYCIVLFSDDNFFNIIGIYSCYLFALEAIVLCKYFSNFICICADLTDIIAYFSIVTMFSPYFHRHAGRCSYGCVGCAFAGCNEKSPCRSRHYRHQLRCKSYCRADNSISAAAFLFYTFVCILRMYDCFRPGIFPILEGRAFTSENYSAGTGKRGGCRSVVCSNPVKVE